MNIILLSALILGIIAFLASILLYWSIQKFKVEEDPRIDIVEAELPGANCGGCGYAGCRTFAEECVKSSTMENLNCPVSDKTAMSAIAIILGVEFAEIQSTAAVVRCNGSCKNRQHKNIYLGGKNCAVAAMTYGGETDCNYGCLGFGDCVNVCAFDAIHINPETQLPEIDKEKCSSCKKCVKECPKNLIEIRKKGEKSQLIFVACRNTDKGGIAKRACDVACIGCAKCQKVCEFDAISIENNLAYIDSNKCSFCRKCISVCPTNCIIEI
jgi:RnfABCDGE-type electron transport complex B subunit